MSEQEPQHGGKREGAGRPRKYRDSTRVTVFLPAALVAKIDRQAKKRGISRSEAIATVLAEQMG